MRMRETVRQLSHQWETRNDPVRQTLVANLGGKPERNRLVASRLSLCSMQTLRTYGFSPVTIGIASLKAQERNSTDSRWNIFTAIKMAAPPYRQVERKISAIEFQW
jgi:hypothetical protein